MGCLSVPFPPSPPGPAPLSAAHAFLLFVLGARRRAGWALLSWSSRRQAGCVPVSGGGSLGDSVPPPPSPVAGGPLSGLVSFPLLQLQRVPCPRGTPVCPVPYWLPTCSLRRKAQPGLMPPGSGHASPPGLHPRKLSPSPPLSPPSPGPAVSQEHLCRLRSGASKRAPASLSLRRQEPVLLRWTTLGLEQLVNGFRVLTPSVVCAHDTDVVPLPQCPALLPAPMLSSSTLEAGNQPRFSYHRINKCYKRGLFPPPISPPLACC